MTIFNSYVSLPEGIVIDFAKNLIPLGSPAARGDSRTFHLRNRFLDMPQLRCGGVAVYPWTFPLRIIKKKVVNTCGCPIIYVHIWLYIVYVGIILYIHISIHVYIYISFIYLYIYIIYISIYIIYISIYIIYISIYTHCTFLYSFVCINLVSRSVAFTGSMDLKLLEKACGTVSVIKWGMKNS